MIIINLNSSTFLHDLNLAFKDTNVSIKSFTKYSATDILDFYYKKRMMRIKLFNLKSNNKKAKSSPSFLITDEIIKISGNNLKIDYDKLVDHYDIVEKASKERIESKAVLKFKKDLMIPYVQSKISQIPCLTYDKTIPGLDLKYFAILYQLDFEKVLPKELKSNITFRNDGVNSED